MHGKLTLKQKKVKEGRLMQVMLPHLLLLLLLHILWVDVGESSSASLALPGCREKCGNISIPYPFGIGAGCYRIQSEGFEIFCNHSFRPPRPFIASTSQLEIIQIEALLEELHVRAPVAHSCFNDSLYYNASINLDGTPFAISAAKNKFFSLGCGTTASLGVYCGKGNCAVAGGCLSSCLGFGEGATCDGIGCCAFGIPKRLKNFLASINQVNDSNFKSLKTCGYAFIADGERFNFYKTPISDYDSENFTDKIRDNAPLVLDWVVGNETCREAQSRPNTYACGANSICSDSTNGLGYRCNCLDGYEGNPYHPQGCQDSNECEDSTKNTCATGTTCINSLGGYNCSCPEGTYGDVKRDGKGCIEFRFIKIIVGVGSGLVVLLVFGAWIYWVIEKRKFMKLREKFFKQIGGLILQQHISLHQDATEKHQIFSAKELKKATDNYNENRIVGKGGHGTVYKGILSDKTPVAVKKAKIVDQSQIEEFSNEVKILSQINHRNVVKLVGSCLETEIPLLVYEYVSNGTLFEHIHGDGNVSSLSWDNRLRIAAETASALAYLHSAASIPIIHRDVKSANILLDNNYTAKVSDFGASRLVPMDKNQITTLVQGTLGYLDPEYLLTSKFTEKSDVYSFGVVLVELLTGKIPFSFIRSEEKRNLCQWFILSMKENCLSGILDSRIVDEGIKEQIVAVAKLAKRCLEVKGDERPTMKEAAAELEGLRRFEKHLWVQENAEECSSGYGGMSSNAILEIDMVHEKWLEAY